MIAIIYRSLCHTPSPWRQESSGRWRGRGGPAARGGARAGARGCRVRALAGGEGGAGRGARALLPFHFALLFADASRSARCVLTAVVSSSPCGFRLSCVTFVSRGTAWGARARGP